MKVVDMRTKTIRLQEEGHRYFVDGCNTELMSVSTFFKLYFPPFEKEKILKATARKRLLPQAVIAEEWKQAGAFGTIVHEYAENKALGKPTIPAKNQRETDYFLAVNKFYKDHPEVLIEPKTEQIVGSIRTGIAGTIDHKYKLGDGIGLIDLKTNKAIYKKANYKSNHAKAYFPISFMNNCNLSKYQLQLSMYAFHLETEYKEKVKDLKLVHLLPNSKYKIYHIPYLRNHIIMLLAYAGKLNDHIFT